MPRSPLFPAVLALTACGGEGGGGGGNSSTDRFADFINTEVEATGDFTGFVAGEDWESTAWLTQSARTDLVGTSFTVQGTVEDFEDGFAVDDADVVLWYDDRVDASPDTEATSDVNGHVSLPSPACQPVAYRVTTDPTDPSPTKTTFKAHHIYPPPTDGDVIDDGLFISVSEVTYQLIPTILGITVDPDKAIIAGTAFDLTRDPATSSDDDTGKIEGAQVVVYDEKGHIPDSLAVNYFIANFPDRDQEHTSADGLWVASNVPPGNLRVEMWGRVDGELILLGASELLSEANSINIANVFAGYGDGRKYPAACEEGSTL